jgi:hypothetical protein
MPVYNMTPIRYVTDLLYDELLAMSTAVRRLNRRFLHSPARNLTGSTYVGATRAPKDAEVDAWRKIGREGADNVIEMTTSAIDLAQLVGVPVTRPWWWDSRRARACRGGRMRMP